MKSRYSISVLLGAFLIIANSCKNDSKAKASQKSVGEVQAVNACFERYSTNYEKLLTKADISKSYPIDFSIAKMEYDTAFSSPSYQQMIYFWPSERTRTIEVMDRKMTIPVDNKIGMGSVRIYSEEEDSPVELFKSMYDLTDTEKKSAKKAIQKELKKNEEIKDNTKKEAKKLTGGILSAMKFSPVEDVGDAAVWDYMESGLIVLKDRTRFTVFVDVGTDHEEEVALAKKLAKSILAKCN